MLQDHQAGELSYSGPAAGDFSGSEGPVASRRLGENRAFSPPRTAFEHAGPVGAFRPTGVGGPGPQAADPWACRTFDVLVAGSALLFTAPLLAILCLLIFIQDGGNPIFAHQRVGRGGRPFKCLKLRSMLLNSQERLDAILAQDPEARAEWERDRKLRRDPRVTPLGRFLRTSSLDELPQLVNVLVGDMGIVGPRPIVKDEVARYGRQFRHYCAVRPGITGLWQVSGRNDVSYRTRVAMDVVYAKSKSFMLDLRIVAATIPAVFKGSY